MESGLRIDDHHDRIGLVGGGFGLTPRRVGELEAVGHIGTRIDSRGVNEAEDESPPIAKRIEPVAGHARRILDNGEAAPNEPVEKRALADVRPSHNRDRRRVEHPLPFAKLFGRACPAFTSKPSVVK